MHYLYGDSTLLGNAWDVAGAAGSSVEDRVQALAELSARRTELLGPVFFETPEGAVDDERWWLLVDDTLPYCNCPTRRMLYPPRGRSRLLPGATPQRVHVTYTGSDLRHTNFCAAPVLLAPHGGDLASAYLLWSFYHQAPIAVQRPCMSDCREGDRLVWNHARLGQSPAHPEEWRMEHDALRHALVAYGELLFFQERFNPDNPIRVRESQVVCAVVGADSDGMCYDTRPRYTLEADASVTVIQPGVSGPLPIHDCQPR